MNKTHFLVMEYVEGSDLSAHVKKYGPFPVDRAVQCLIQAARGLDFAHKRGVVYRDINPANLLLDNEGTVKILDMGLARIEDSVGGSSEGAGLTQSGQIMGTNGSATPVLLLSCCHRGNLPKRTGLNSRELSITWASLPEVPGLTDS